MKNLSIKYKLLLIIIIPFMALLFFSISLALEKKKKNDELNSLKIYLHYSTNISDIMNEIQKERGLSLGYIGSNGNKFKLQLKSQREVVDSKYIKLKRYISTNVNLKKLNINIVMLNKKNLDSFRKQIDSIDISFNDGLKYYNNLIKSLLTPVLNSTFMTKDKVFLRMITSYINILQAKNHAGIQRGILNYSFASAKMPAEIFGLYSTHHTLYNTHIKLFKNYTSNKFIIKQFNTIFKDDSMKEILDLRSVISNKMIKNELISNIKATIGYGGLIHDFKNYVLRGDIKYKNRFNLKYKKLIDSITSYQKLKSTREEFELLSVVEVVFQEYQKQLLKIEKQYSNNIKIVELDKSVKISDTPAIIALNRLSSSIIGIQSEHWFNMATQWINNLSIIENKIVTNLLISVDSTQDKLFKETIIHVLLILILLIVVIILSFIVVKDILSKINILQDGLISFLDYVTKKKDKFKLLELSGDDEFSSMAKVLNESMSQTAVKVVKEVKLAKLQERQVQESSKMAQMGEMIGNIAHQWRQPLSAISTVASGIKLNLEFDMLNLKELPKDMDRITKSTQFLSETIDTFRDFIKTDKEVAELVIQKEIDKALHISHSNLKNNHIELINEIDYDNLFSIRLVVGELPQVIINILNNAKDIMVEKNISDKWIKLTLEKTNTNVIITIEDNGGGIPDKIMPKIFDPYFTTKHQSQGTGIGLYMSYDIIVEHLHGKMYVENTDNGAKFFIELPLDFEG